MDISVIIVNWNVKALLADCLRSLQQYHGANQMEIIVVDSASTDGSVQMLREEFPDVTLIAESENVGFVRGNNLGLAAATGRYLLLLNPDTVVHPHALATLVDYLDAQPEVGIVAPHTLNTDGTHQSTRRQFLTPLTAMIESTWLQDVLPDSLLEGYYLRRASDDGIMDVDWAQGSALMARREVYAQIGGLDTRYIMFFEEVDWCRRAKQAGWRIVYVGNAYITHHGGGSTAQVETRKHVHFQHSKLRYLRQYHGWGVATLMRVNLIMQYGVQVLIEGGKLALGHRVELRRARIQSFAVMLRSLLWAGEGIVER